MNAASKEDNVGKAQAARGAPGKWADMAVTTKNGVLVCLGETEHKNIGDYIQSVAAAQFAGAGAAHVEREALNASHGERIKVVMNGWFMHHPDRFPPAPSIEPLFVSFHVRPRIEKVFFTDETTAYLKAREPIGCRSTDMVDMLARHGIRGEFTSCLTLTLGERFRHVETDAPPIFVDPFFRRFSRRRKWPMLKRFLWRIPYMLRHPVAMVRLVPKFRVFFGRHRPGLVLVQLLYAAEFHRSYSPLFHDDVLLSAEYVSHKVLKKDCAGDGALFAKAEALLARYARAPFVVTSRLHCALPCTGMGTPVWSVLRPAMKTGRYGGNEEFLNVLSFGEDEIVHSPVRPPSPDGKFHLSDRPPIKDAHAPYAAALAARCRAFFAGDDK